MLAAVEKEKREDEEVGARSGLDFNLLLLLHHHLVLLQLPLLQGMRGEETKKRECDFLFLFRRSVLWGEEVSGGQSWLLGCTVQYSIVVVRSGCECEGSSEVQPYPVV